MQILSDLNVLTLGLEGFVDEASRRLPGLKWHLNSADFAWKIRQLFRGRVSEYEFWDDFAETIIYCLPEVHNRSGAGTMNASWFKKLFYENALSAIPGTLDVFKRILYYPMHIGHGGRVGNNMPMLMLIADSADETIAELHSHLPDIFETIKAEIWSSRAHQVKTDPCFFNFILKGYINDPDEYLFISKDKEAIELAKKSGIPCINFVNAKLLEEEMDALGFTFRPKE